jgi:hypothetical protein
MTQFLADNKRGEQKQTLMRRVSGMPGLHSCVADPMSTPLRKMEARTERVMGELKMETATR